MSKTILITGSTDGIGLETAKMFASQGHTVLLHGRNPSKLATVAKELVVLSGASLVECYTADLSSLLEVDSMVNEIKENHTTLDVLINNAGVYSASQPLTPDGLDVRFAVNAIAPYLLTKRLLPLFGTSGRVLNLSSAAQSPVNLQALVGKVRLSEGAAYAQSKLALTMWSRSLALSLADKGPAIIAVNPGSLLGSKLVKEAFGITGGDIGIGANILVRAALSDEFGSASGQYFDNDKGQFAPPHPDGLDAQKCQAVIDRLERILAEN